MRNFIFIFFFLAASVFCSCKKDSKTFILAVDAQSSFDQDSVRVSVDGQDLINKRLQTNYALGVCLQDGQVSTTKKEGSHEIKVNVNNTATRTERFSLTGHLYIGINYDQQTKEISIVYSGQPFRYD